MVRRVQSCGGAAPPIWPWLGWPDGVLVQEVWHPFLVLLGQLWQGLEGLRATRRPVALLWFSWAGRRLFAAAWALEGAASAAC